MSMSKMVPDHLKPRECERTKLREPLPVPYVPEKDEVQEEVSKTRNMEIKMLIEKDTTMNFPVWQGNGTREAIFDARDCSAPCNQEAWSFWRLQKGRV
jgi:hypothetical protein